ncbi:HxlR family transcriptional regulator [Sphingopyxis sp. H050]|jgi:DNA-binding HxlR family transcriptional regulator|uniref:winged helix-turn-helix transcriptional regulator n=1 Tax=Sphingopyxis sp. H050 TaxID=1759072 RepID=UPI0007375C61|nr:helix-turn-helix domain-containing protein [Sphingopyxis sp. H050]KTE21750.1 HxlR family transcriptional regulator [Sphingopyxis sp. H050]
MANTSYGQFCPVAMAAEVLCTRWTIVLVRELAAGSTRFNDLRRGVPRMSPALLSQRLKELEAAGIVYRAPAPKDSGVFDYRLTRAGQELAPVVEAFGVWGKRWIDGDLSLEKLDVQLLMWDMRRGLVLDPMPDRKTIVQFRYTDLPADRRSWWLVIEPGAETQLCSVDPGQDVDLYAATDLRTMTAIWMGYDRVGDAVEERRLILTGDEKLTGSIESWLGLSPFAKTAPAKAAEAAL